MPPTGATRSTPCSASGRPGGDERARAEPWRSPHIRFFLPATLRRMLLDAGFDRVEVLGLPFPLLRARAAAARVQPAGRRRGARGGPALAVALRARDRRSRGAWKLPAAHERSKRIPAHAAPPTGGASSSGRPVTRMRRRPANPLVGSPRQSKLSRPTDEGKLMPRSASWLSATI